MGVRPILGVDLAFSPRSGDEERASGESTHSDPGRRLPRRPAAPGDLPGQRPQRVGGGVPAGLGDPRRRRARHPGVHARAGRRARRRARRPGAARAGLRAGPRGHAAARRPRPRGPGAVARPGRSRAAHRRGGLPPAARLRAGVLAARRPDDRPGPVRTDPVAGRALQRGPLRRPARRPDDRRARRGPAAGADGPAPPRPPQRRGLLEVRQADARGRRGDLPLRRAGGVRAVGHRAARPAPAPSPTSASSTPAPTSASGRCTSRSSRCSAEGAPSADHAAAGPLRGGHRLALRQRAPPAHLEAARRRARDHPHARLRVVLPHRRRRHRR